MPCVLHFYKDGDETDSCADGDSENYRFFSEITGGFFSEILQVHEIGGKQVCTKILRGDTAVESKATLKVVRTRVKCVLTTTLKVVRTRVKCVLI